MVVKHRNRSFERGRMEDTFRRAAKIRIFPTDAVIARKKFKVASIYRKSFLGGDFVQAPSRTAWNPSLLSLFIFFFETAIPVNRYA